MKACPQRSILKHQIRSSGSRGQPFFVNAELTAWPRGERPRIAGVNAAGVGGTNVHLIVEEAPLILPAAAAAPEEDAAQLIILSARDDTALAQARSRLAAHVESACRREPWRYGVYFADGQSRVRPAVRRRRHGQARLARQARRSNGKAVTAAVSPPKLAFLFPGQGAQYAGMGQALYRRYPVVAQTIDRCAAILEPLLGLDLRKVLYGDPAEAGPRLQATALAQPALFSVSLSVAALWRSLGLEPAAMLGHSIGEFVAAVLAGVMRLDDALKVVAARGALMQELPEGAMLAVMLTESELLAGLPADLSIAAVNAEAVCVVAGPHAAIAAFEETLNDSRDRCAALADVACLSFGDGRSGDRTAGANPAANSPSAPRIPYVSSMSGRWITADQATDPLYWARHCRETVRYAAALASLFETESPILLEVGPGRTLSSLARQSKVSRAAPLITASLPDPAEKCEADEVFLEALGRLWAAGVTPDWRALHEGTPRRRVSLPTYPFQRKRYFIDAPSASPAAKRSLSKEITVAPWRTKHCSPLRPRSPIRATTRDIRAGKRRSGPNSRLCSRIFRASMSPTHRAAQVSLNSASIPCSSPKRAKPSRPASMSP